MFECCLFTSHKYNISLYVGRKTQLHLINQPGKLAYQQILRKTLTCFKFKQGLITSLLRHIIAQPNQCMREFVDYNAFSKICYQMDILLIILIVKLLRLKEIELIKGKGSNSLQ